MSQKDPRSWIHRIQDLGFWRILEPTFPFCRGILWILDPVAAKLSWDPRNIGSEAAWMSLDPGDPGSSLGRLRDLADLGFCTVTTYCILKMLNIQRIFVVCFHIFVHCLSLNTLYEFQLNIDSAILCRLENKLTLLAPPHAILLAMFLIKCVKLEVNVHFVR